MTDPAPVGAAPARRPKPFPRLDDAVEALAQPGREAPIVDQPAVATAPTEIVPPPVPRHRTPQRELAVKDRRQRPAWLGTPVLILAALVVAVAAVVGALALRGGSSGDSASEVNAAQAKAEAGAIALWSYNYKTFDADLKAAIPLATSTFGRSYSAVADDLVKPAALKRHVVVTLALVSSAVQSTSAKRCVFLVTLAATTVARGGARTVATVVARTTMERENGRWLVDDLTAQ